MKEYPPCKKCGKTVWVHGLIGARLACAWEKRKVTVEGDFGPQTPLVVHSVYLDLGKTPPKGVVTSVLGLKKRGITSWNA